MNQSNQRTTPKNGIQIKVTIFQQDGTTVDYISEFDPNTGKLVKTTHFNPDGTIIDIINY
ncbi:DUF2963 domain-containing protein [Candidatus Phytoplasma solani]|uniref:DUF2963 domain-containing protein n=1 Tax=Candidatus Phytoplasma solani TaxID=69896 RepID=UPI00358F8A7A